jgi:hypothetical protein
MIEMLNARNCKDVFVIEDADNVILLVNADDIACMFDTVHSLGKIVVLCRGGIMKKL